MDYNINVGSVSMTIIIKNGILVGGNIILRWLKEINLKGDTIILKK